MKRDMDLVRKILMKMEKDWGYDYFQGRNEEIRIEGYPTVLYIIICELWLKKD